MNSGSSSRVSIPNNLRKTLQSIREITGKQHSDEDIYAVYKESFNDPYETAQKLLFIDTFHEVRSKRDKKKENVVPVAQGSNRNGGRNFANQGYGRSGSFKRESGENHGAGGFRPSRPAPNRGRNFTAPRANKVSGQSVVGNNKARDDVIASVDKGLVEEHPLPKSGSASADDVEPEKSKAVSETVATAPVSVPVKNNEVEKVQPFTFGRQDASRSLVHSDQVTQNGTASVELKDQSLPKSDVGERSHVTFPFHIQAAEVLQNGLTFGSFGSNFVKEISPNNGTSGGDDSNFESSQGTGDDEEDSSSATNGIPEVASAREGASSFSDDKDHEISHSAAGNELVVDTDQIVQPAEEVLLNIETPQFVYGQGAPLSMFGLVPSLPALGQPVSTEAAETQPGNSNVSAISLASYPPDHLFRQQYHPSFYPYGPYYPPFYMAPPFIHQFVSPNGIPQQSYYPPGAALAAPSPIQPIGNTENFPTTNPPTQVTHIPSGSDFNSIRSEDRTSPLPETGGPWIGQGLGNLQASSMYNLALQSQLLGFQAMQAGHGGLMGVPHPTQPMAAGTTSYRTLPPPPITPTAMTEPTEHPRIAYQQPQAAQINWVNNY